MFCRFYAEVETPATLRHRLFRNLRNPRTSPVLVTPQPVTIAEDVGGSVGLEATYTALHDEVADVLLRVIGDAAEFGIEIGRAGDVALHLGRDFSRGVGAVCFQSGDPLADGAPWVSVGVWPDGDDWTEEGSQQLSMLASRQESLENRSS